MRRLTTLLFGSLLLLVTAVAVAQEPAKKDEPKKDEVKKDEAKKDEPKKDDPKKDEPKKDDPKKDEPKKDDKKKDDKAKESSWYPLAVGNTWEFKLSDGKVDAKMTLKVTRLEKFGKAGTMCARIDAMADGKVLEFEHLAVTDEGVFRYSIGGNEPDRPVQILKTPPKKGDSWGVESKIKDETLKGTFNVTTEATLKVPAGEYKNVVVVEGKNLDMNGLKVSLTFYYAEKTGPVKMVIEVGNQKAVYELVEFKAAK